MGTSFTRFKGYGFWARDKDMVIWMACLATQMDQQKVLSEKQYAFRDDLMLQVDMCVNGAVSDCLEHLQNSDEITSWAVSMGRLALNELESKGESVEGAWLNRLLKSEGAANLGIHIVDGPTKVDEFKNYGRKWMNLLEGKFVPLPPLSSGKFHATGEIEVDVTEATSAQD